MNKDNKSGDTNSNFKMNATQGNSLEGRITP